MNRLGLLVLTTITLLSFYLRINFLPLYEKFGFYQGDIWYFFTFYGEQIKNDFFYQIEYPVGYIFIQKFAYILSIGIFREFNYQSFMFSHILLILPGAILAFLLFIKIGEELKLNLRPRVLAFILSPSLALYSTINYDIFPMTATLGATYFLLKQKVALSFLLLALGTIIKIYPLFLLPLFILFCLFKKIKINSLIKATLLFALTVLFIQLPFLINNKDFWLYPYIYQSQNPERQDPTTISYFLFHTFNLDHFRIYFLNLLIFFSWIISFLFYLQKILNNQNLIYLILLTLFSLVFGNQVYTPQYILWFLPFLLLSGIIPIFLWFPFDLLNASSRFFYFNLKGDYSYLLTNIWSITVVYYLVLYLLLINYGRIKLNEKS